MPGSDNTAGLGPEGVAHHGRIERAATSGWAAGSRGCVGFPGLRRVDADTLEYQFTVNDPATFTRPFTGIIPMKKSSERVYEFACHEGNYALRNILSGARQAESQSAK